MAAESTLPEGVTMMKQMSIFLVEHPSKANKNICELAKAFVTSLSVSLTKPLIKKKGLKAH